MQLSDRCLMEQSFTEIFLMSLVLLARVTPLHLLLFNVKCFFTSKLPNSMLPCGVVMEFGLVQGFHTDEVPIGFGVGWKCFG